jgi:hypothetical protein
MLPGLGDLSGAVALQSYRALLQQFCVPCLLRIPVGRGHRVESVAVTRSLMRVERTRGSVQYSERWQERIKRR